MKLHKFIPRVTIGIPAYNEEGNIKKLLECILSQKQNNFIIEKIIVVSDGSSDGTVVQAQSVKDERIKILSFEERKGQAIRQNEIFSNAKTDIVVILEADTLPKVPDYLLQLLRVFWEYPGKYNLAQGQAIAVPRKGVLGSLQMKQISVYRTFWADENEQVDRIATGRGGRAFSFNLYSRLRWPEDVPEDLYALQWSRMHGYKITYISKAQCYYFLPTTISDFLLQRKKIKIAHRDLWKHFPENCPDFVSLRQIPLRVSIQMSLSFFKKSPLYCIGYAILKTLEIISKFLPNIKSFNPLIPTALSTKKMEDI